MYEKFDVNGDGKLSRKEFRKLIVMKIFLISFLSNNGNNVFYIEQRICVKDLQFWIERALHCIVHIQILEYSQRNTVLLQPGNFFFSVSCFGSEGTPLLTVHYVQEIKDKSIQILEG